jgi:hypothetical protein
MKILIKFPTRGRPDKFFAVLERYIAMADDVSKIAFLISADEDDSTMNNPSVIEKLEKVKKNTSWRIVLVTAKQKFKL